MGMRSRKVKREYSFCRSLVFAIQSITGEKTHDILATLVSKAEEVIKVNEINVAKPIQDSWYAQMKCRDYIYYPNTKLYLGVYINVVARHDGSWNSPIPLYNIVSYNFKLPNSYVKMNQQEFDDIAVDGMLTDSSFNFDKPTIKRPKTPAELKKVEEDKQVLLKAKREIREAARAAKKNTMTDSNRINDGGKS